MDLGIRGKRALVMGSSYGMGNGVARARANGTSPAQFVLALGR